MLKKATLVLALILVLGAGVASAQPAAEPLRWHVYGGWSPLSGAAGDHLDDGWNLSFGSIYTPNPKRPFGLRFDLEYHAWDVKTGTIPTGELRVDDGDANIWNLRAGLHTERVGERATFYGGTGIGGYSLYANVTNSVLVPGYICDPWYWWICYPGLVEGDVIVGDEQTTKFGYYVNLGVSWDMGGGEGFVEANYHWVQTKETFEYFPINLGYRW